MLYGSSWLYKSYTEESLTHITITAYYNVGEAFLQASTASWGNLWDCRAALRKLVSSVYLESDLNLPFGKKRKILIPTWVYSCCVRHEENRSENCRIVFSQMDISRMGYGYCNIIYGQIRQKSLIFFVYLWYHSLRDLHHCYLRLWLRLRHSKKLSEKHNEVTIFETSNFSCLLRCTFLRCASGRRLHSKSFSARPSANWILQFDRF